MLKTFDYENTPVVNLVNEIIIDAVKHKASDIHFDPTPTVLNVRIRIDGELVDYAEVPEVVKKNLTTRIKIISGMNITESRLPQDGAIKSENDGNAVDLRVSSLPIVDGEKIVIRILDYSMSLEGLETLGLSEKNLAIVKKMISVPNGIILTTGATGTGKSTTVYAMLQRLNTRERNIITVEDPVEMKIPGINQVQVNSEIGLTFGATLRSILRQDPDIIMIGEIRDDETARIAVRASITGHLVLSTIHTNNSLNTIERLLDMDIERYLLGSALTGIISQRLTKKLCPHCRKARPTTPYERNVFREILHQEVDQIYEPVGCEKCIKGYKGRVAVHEALLLNQSVRDAIVNGMNRHDLRRLVYEECDTTSLLVDGLQKVINGDTSFEEIVRVIDIESDIDDEDVGIKNALLGKNIDQNMANQPQMMQNIIPNNQNVIATERPITTPIANPGDEFPRISVSPLNPNQQVYDDFSKVPNSDILNRELNNMAPTMATPQPMPQPQPVNQNTNPNNYNISNFANFDLLDI
ncbi:MAG: type II/IV secretion system protein [Bacilli bacterium]|nr:type II/IV secretion system protein [Bacilli bacterium]